MTHEPASPDDRCPNCGASLGDPPAVRCSACGWWSVLRPAPAAHERIEDVNPYAPPRAEVGARRAMHLGTLMLLIAVIGVLIGVTVQEPVVGVVLSLITVPALIRTSVAVNRHRDRLPPGAARVAGLFVGSFAVSGLTVFAAFLAFCVTCFPVGLVTFEIINGVGLVVAGVVGVLAALFVIVLLGRKIWPIPVPFDARRDIVYLDERNEPDKRRTTR
jgi:hypothetical protein